MENINEILMTYLYDLKHDIQKYKYNTVIKRELEYKYNRMLSKINNIDLIVEKMSRTKI